MIEGVSAYLPAPRVDVEQHLRGYDIDAERIRVHRRYFGFAEIRLEPRVRWVDQSLAAVAGLPGFGERKHRLHYLLQARTLPVAAPYPVNPLHEVRQALGLSRVTAFCLSQQACASTLFAVDLAGRLLNEDGDPDGLALILTGEKAFTTRATVIADVGVTGEGMAAVLVGRAGERDRVLSYASRTYGEFNPGAGTLADASRVFRDVYTDAMVEVIRAAADRAGLRPDEIDLVLPHHANRLSWQRVARQAGIDARTRVFLDNLPRVGHCFGADSFVNYCSARRTGRLRPGDRYLMTAVGLGTSFATAGLGATFSAMLLRH